MGLESTYQTFWRRCVRNLVVGTGLSIIPAGAFYFFVLPYSPQQWMVLAVLGVLDLLIFLPLDIAVLKWTLRDVRNACTELETQNTPSGAEASEETVRKGLVALLDAPRRV